jgi:hypothetical protein
MLPCSRMLGLEPPTPHIAILRSLLCSYGIRVSETLDPIDADWKRQLTMNPNATESVPQCALRQCSEDLDQLRQERRFIQSLFEEAKRTHAEESMAIIRAWLPRSRASINRLSAEKTRLRHKLDAANAVPVIGQ